MLSYWQTAGDTSSCLVRLPWGDFRMARIRVRVQPGASANRVLDFRDGALRVRVTAPPIDGKANAAVLRLVSDFLRVPRNHARIIRGAASREKVLEVETIDEEYLLQRLRSVERQPAE